MADTDTDDNVEDLPAEEDNVQEEEEVIYDSATFLSGPRFSEKCTIHYEILKFDYSYGFTSRKYFNIAKPDPDHLLLTAGNIMHIFDVLTLEMVFRRSAQGGGIGNIRTNTNPGYSHIAIAENGNNFGAKPLVVIYEWPTLDIVTVLKGGSTESFSNLDYSPDGMLLVSQAGEPDYLITIYDWSKHTIMLRTKSYVNDVYRVKFSPSVPGQLCTAGVAHIKFWKMCNTFTGLKLKGEVGRFGKTEYTDIVGVIPMPDEKVVSGCKWGNLLLWEGGLIKVEVMRNNRKPLHEKQIVQIFYLEGELWTISQDGHVKVWWYEKIDQADPPEDDRVVMLEPSYDFHTPGTMWMCIVKRYADPDSYKYFAQDGNGGIWLIDCNVFETPEESKRLVRCHASDVVDLVVSPCNHFFATLDREGCFFAYNYIERKIIFEHNFPAKGACMIWLPTTLVPSGDEIFIGFDDGNIRACLLEMDENEEDIIFSIVQIIKPHSEPLTCMSLNPTEKVLVSGGADYTLFIFQLELKNQCAILIPIGYIPSPDIPSCIIWNPVNPITMTVGCLRGSFMEAEVLTEPQFYTTVSYLLKVKTKCRKFMSYKSQIRRDIEISIIEARKAVKRDKKRVEMEKLKEQNPGLEIDEEVFLADSESSIKWDPLYIPETPGDILWMQHTPDDTLWLSMTGYDAGYIYEYHIDQKEDIPLRFQMVADADDVEISSFVYNYNKKYLVFGMQDGAIRFNRVNPNDWRDFGNYWTLSMHENLNGVVPRMAFSYDERYFFSCGQDGNVFSYTFHPEYYDYKPEGWLPRASARTQKLPVVLDEGSQDTLSLEQAMIKAENDRINRVAEQNKKIYRSKIAILRERYAALLKRNAALPESQRIRKDHLEVDPRVTEALHIQLERKVALVRRKMAFELSKADILLKKLRAYYLERVDYFPLTVTALVRDTQISCLRQKRLPQILFNMHSFIDIKILEADMKGRVVERAAAVAKAKAVRKKKSKELEYFLLTLSQSTLDMRLDAKFTRLLNKYRTRKAKWESRQDQWEDFMALQPVEGLDHPDDVAALSYAEKNIGDFKLKTNANYKVANPQDRETTLKKFRQLMIGRRKQYNIRNKFSEKVYNLRAQKEEVRQLLLRYQKKLKKIHEEIPDPTRKEGPTIPPQKESEYPEKQFQVVVDDDDAELAEEQYMVTTTKHIQRFVEEPDLDAFEREITRGMDKIQNIEEIIQDVVFLEKSKGVCNVAFNDILKISKDEFTPWEMEIRAFRLKRMLFEQEDLIQKMNDALEDFDDRLENLNNERSEAQMNGFFCDLYLHKLHQELIILKDFESHEEILQEKVNAKTAGVLDMEDDIGEIKSQIEAKNLSIEKNLEQQALIHEQFNKMIHDNKFSDFLKKVFRKKYKPPKVQHGEDSSSESSSSSSSESEEEDDTGSIDSRDFGFIKQDLNVCPKGCEQEIFDNTISLRSERHQLEIGVRDCQREIEGLKKDLELSMKKLKVMNASLQTSQEELTSYQREKQQKLNEVECTVMLNLDQVQNIKEDGEVWPISECLVFSKTILTKLYKRVGELQSETMKLKSRHLVDIKHLARMKTDLKYMHNEIYNLKQKIIELVKLKFGKVLKMHVIDEHLEKKTFGDDIVNELMEVMFRKMVHDLRMSLADIKSLYKGEMRLWEKKLENTEKEYVEALKENTARMDLLSLLKKEKSALSAEIADQEKKRELVYKKHELSKEMEIEMKNLKEILKQQEKEIEIMRNEIRVLKSKSRFPPEKKEEEFKADDARKEAFQDIEHAKDYLYPELIGEETSLSDLQLPTLAEEEMKRDRDETIKSVVTSIIENFEVNMEKESLENFIRETIMPMVDYASVNEIIREIVDKIGVEPSEDQLNDAKSMADLLSIGSIESINVGPLWMKESSKPVPPVSDMSSEEIKMYVGMILDDILKDMMSQTEEFKYQISLCNIMMRAVEEIPVEVLKRAEAAEVISEKLSSCSCFSKDSIDKVKMAEVIQVWEECLCGSKDSIDKVELAEVEIDWDDTHAPVRRVVDELLNRVFATGLDIITFHR